MRFRFFLPFLVAYRRARRENRALRLQLAAERERHRQREEALVDRVLTAANQYGLPEAKPQPARRPPKPVIAPIAKPANALEEAELEFYEQCAVEAGFSPSRGVLDWAREREKRREMAEFDEDEEIAS